MSHATGAARHTSRPDAARPGPAGEETRVPADGKIAIWWNGRMVPYAQAQTHVCSHGLHYGTGVFEGIRAYKTSHGTAIFRLKEHIERLLPVLDEMVPEGLVTLETARVLKYSPGGRPLDGSG